MLLLINNYITNFDLGELEIRHYVGERMKALSGIDYMVLHTSEVNGDTLKKYPEVTGIVSGGSRDFWDDIDAQAEYGGQMELMRKVDVPFLGICGGHAVLGLAFGVGSRRLDFGLERKEFNPVEFTGESPLLTDIPKESMMWDYRWYFLPKAPEGFVNVARAENTDIMMIQKEDGSPLYGTQFHPEKYNDQYPDGKQMFKNFLEIVEKYS
jgi:GMP synthase (glutamine-hydrolysing)